jgi:hypothetical protein
MTTKETSPSKTSTLPKRRGTRFWAVCAVLVLGMPLLFYYGYCWGLWGRHSLLLQYLFQCTCPPASEEARYPKDVDVIVSACRLVSSRLSPSGRLLFVGEKIDGVDTKYLLDLDTMEKTNIEYQPFPNFLTDDLWFIESGLEDTIIDRTADRQYSIKAVRYWREDTYENGKPNLELLVSALHQAKHIFFIQNNDTVVVLMYDFPINLEKNFTFGCSDITGWNSNRVEQFLQENNITYQTIPDDFRNEVISPDGKFVARPSGIYLIEMDQRIITSYTIGCFFHPFSGKYLEVRGWTNDGTGVIYSKFLNPCLIEMGIPGGVACFYEVPQPVIKLKVPEDYLSPQEIP